jgi:hypothetical protein
MSTARPLGRVTADAIAQVAHAANRAWCRMNGLPVREVWENLDAERRGIVIAGVERMLQHPETTPAQSHEHWCLAMQEAGWTYGAERDEAQKHHECLVPYAELPEADRLKDTLFRAIVLALGHPEHEVSRGT